MNSVTVLYGSRIGEGNTFFPGAVIGAIPQDLKFKEKKLLLRWAITTSSAKT